MWISVVLGLSLAAQAAPAPAKSGVIAGKITPPQNSKLARPAQVVLLTPEYAEMFNTDVQERMDNYWEQYKPTFIQQKEMYREVAKMAYRNSFEWIVRQIQRSSPTRAGFLRDTTADGKFDFTNVPTGNYKLVAMGWVGGEEVVWQESVELTGFFPLYVQLKKPLP